MNMKRITITNIPETGYKAFNKDWKCRDMQYRLGDTHRFDGYIELCKSGFHYCTNPLLVNTYTPNNDDGHINATDYKYAKVNASGTIVSSGDKSVTDILEIVEEIDYSTWVGFGENKEIVLDAVNKDGMTLLYASKELKKDKEVVLAAVNQNGLALQYAGNVLKNDKDVVLAAIKQNRYALEYASDKLR